MNPPFFSEKSTTKRKEHGIFADELLLALDEVESPFNLGYICRWKLFVVEWLKQDPHMQLCELSLHLHGCSTSLLQWPFGSKLEIRNRSSPLVKL